MKKLEGLTQAQIRDSVVRVANMCHNSLYLKENEDVLRYIRDERGLSDETIDAFHLGVFPPSGIIAHNMKHIFAAFKLGLVFFTEDGYFDSRFEKNRFIIPIRNSYGEPCALMGRTTLSEDEQEKFGIPKYINSNYRKSHSLFGLAENKETIRASGEAFVVEGNLDVISAWQNGMRNVVAASSARITPYQFAILSRHCRKIIILLDNDEAGRLGRDKAVKRYSSLSGVQLCVGSLPKDVKDLDELFKKGFSQRDIHIEEITKRE